MKSTSFLFELRQRIGSLRSWTSLLGNSHYSLWTRGHYDISYASYDDEIDAQFQKIRQDAISKTVQHLEDSSAIQYFDNQLSRMNAIVGILREMPAGTRGVDVGIAFGYHSIVLKEFYRHEIAGLDRPDGIQKYCGFPLSKGIKIVDWTIGRDPMPLQKGLYDYVIFAEVLEHLKTSPELVLREMASCLRINGLLILSTPNIGRFDNIWRLTRGLNIVEKYPPSLRPGEDATDYIEHVREYTILEVVTLLEDAGFKIDRIRMCNKNRTHTVPKPYLEETMCIVARKIK